MIAIARSGKNTGPGQAAQHREEEREDEDEDLRDAEDLDVQPERARDLRERRLELVPVEELPLHLGPARGVRDRHDDDRREDDGAQERDGDAPAAVAAGAQSVEQARAPRYFKIGAPVAFASHSCWSRLSVPSARSELIALFTQAVSELPLASATPNRSVALPLFSNWPRILLPGHLHGRDVERGRQVDDEAVDLLVLQRQHRAGVRREHRRLSATA